MDAERPRRLPGLWHGVIEYLPIAVLGAVGFGALTVAGGYQLGTLDHPGPGLMPRIYAVGLIVAAATVLILRDHSIAIDIEEGDVDATSSPARPLLIFAGLIVFWLIADVIGFIAALWLLFLFVTGVLDRGRWLTKVVVATMTVSVAYAVFVVWLDVPLPRGILGF